MANLGIFEKVLSGIILLVILALPFGLVQLDKREKACNQLGGTMVKTTDGWVCFKLERLTT